MPRARELTEFSAIAKLAAIFGESKRSTGSGSRVEVAIGDDAAVVRQSGPFVWTVDTAVEHVHFEREWLTLADLGWRSFQAAASDVCAMGGKPVCALSSVIFPVGFSESELRQLARGQRDAARALGCTIVGGNLSRGHELSITTTLIGQVQRPLLRSGARVGDELWLCGNVGLAAAGLRLLQRGHEPKSHASRRALAAFRRPSAELELGLALTRRAHAAIDISDGLAGDAAHLARASGVRLIIDAPSLQAALSPELHALAPQLGMTALALALHGGEDYALLATGPRRARPAGASPIGVVEAGRGVWIRLAADERAGRGNGKKRAASRRDLVRAGPGFEHSSGRRAERVGR